MAVSMPVNASGSLFSSFFNFTVSANPANLDVKIGRMRCERYIFCPVIFSSASDTEVASVSDALEKITGQKMYLSHRMRPIFTSKFAGFALTVKLKKEENKDPDALTGMLTDRKSV